MRPLAAVIIVVCTALLLAGCGAGTGKRGSAVNLITTGLLAVEDADCVGRATDITHVYAKDGTLIGFCVECLADSVERVPATPDPE